MKKFAILVIFMLVTLIVCPMLFSANVPDNDLPGYHAIELQDTVSIVHQAGCGCHQDILSMQTVTTNYMDSSGLLYHNFNEMALNEFKDDNYILNIAGPDQVIGIVPFHLLS